MNIIVTGRHLTVADGIREYAEKKFEKLSGYFNQVGDAHVILHLEKIARTAEIIINGDGVSFHGREKGETFFAAIDLLVEKMDKQIVKYKSKNQAQNGPRTKIQDSLFYVEIDSNDDEQEIKLHEVSNKPQDQVEAYLQMKNDKRNFTLFKQGVSEVDSNVDFANKRYAVIFQAADGFRMTEIPFEMIQKQEFDENSFVEYKLTVKDESPAHPDIAFTKTDASSVKAMTVPEAVLEFDKSGKDCLPFFNLESNYFNIVYKKGKDYTVMVPSF